jgi:hypothetical protein
VSQRQSIQLVPVLPPQRHEPVHQGRESFVVATLQKVEDFVDDDA